MRDDIDSFGQIYLAFLAAAIVFCFCVVVRGSPEAGFYAACAATFLTFVFVLVLL